MVISLKHLIRKRLSIQEMMDLFTTLHNEPDHSVAIIGAAYVEDALREAILFRMKLSRLPWSVLPSDLSKTDEGDLFDGPAPLSTFSAKIRISYALGLFGAQTRYDLNTIKEIRNVFSHALAGASFSMDDIKRACFSIGFWRRLSMNQGKSYTEDAKHYFAANAALLWIYLFDTLNAEHFDFIDTQALTY